MEDVRLLAFDTSIMQSKTVGNICRLLIDGLQTHSLGEATQFLITQRNKAMKSRGRRVKGGKQNKKTTVDSRIKRIKGA